MFSFCNDHDTFYCIVCKISLALAILVIYFSRLIFWNIIKFSISISDTILAFQLLAFNQNHKKMTMVEHSKDCSILKLPSVSFCATSWFFFLSFDIFKRLMCLMDTVHTIGWTINLLNWNMCNRLSHRCLPFISSVKAKNQLPFFFAAKSHLNFTAPIFKLHRKNRKKNVFSPLFKWFVRFQLIKLLSCLHSVNIKSFKIIVIELKKKTEIHQN